VDRLTVVAFYGPKSELAALIDTVQRAFGAVLGDAFRPRPADDVRPTILGLGDAPTARRGHGVPGRRAAGGADPDAHLVVGAVEGPRPGAAEAVRMAIGRPTSVRPTAADPSLVRYVDLALPRGSSTWWPV
jgi:hypothetical protein